jgi:hypothetical protein
MQHHKSGNAPNAIRVVSLCHDIFCGSREQLRRLVSAHLGDLDRQEGSRLIKEMPLECMHRQSRRACEKGEEEGDRNLLTEWKATGARVDECYKAGGAK